MEKAALGSSYTEMSYYNPNAEYDTLTKTYLIYQPSTIEGSCTNYVELIG
jgi:hypothetical protein